MSETQEAVQARLIGEIFLERGLVGAADLEAALEKQRQTGTRLGEILVADYGVSRLELAGVLAEQWAALERTPKPAPIAAQDRASHDAPATGSGHEEEAEEDEFVEEGVRRPIGEIFVERGIISEVQLERALEVQRATGKRLGEVLVEQGSLSRLDLAGALAEQWAGLQKLRPPTPKAKPEPWQQRAIRGEETPETTKALGQATEELGALRVAVGALESRLFTVEQSGAGEAWRDEIAAAARSLTVRLEGLEGRLGDLDDLTQAGDELRIALSELRDRPVVAIDRIDDLERRLGDVAGAAATNDGVESLRSRLEDVQQRLDSLQDVSALADRLDAAETRGEMARNEIAGLAARVDELADAVPSRADVETLGSRVAAVETLAARVEEIASTSARTDALAGLQAEVALLVEVAQAADASRSEIASVADRVRVLEEAPGGASTESVAALQAEVARLAEAAGSLDGLREALTAAGSRIDTLEAAGPAVEPEALEELRREVSRLGESVSGEVRSALDAALRRVDAVASRDGLVEVGALTELRADIERLDAALAAGRALETRVDELSGRIEAQDAIVAEAQRRAIEAVDAIVPRVEALEQAGQPLDEIWSRMRALELGAHPVEDLAHRVEALTARIEGLAEADGEAIADIRSTLESLSTPGVPVEDASGRIAGLEAQVGEIERGLGRRVDEALAVERAARDGLSVRIDDTSRRLVELQSLASRVDELQARIDAGESAQVLDELRAETAGLASRVAEGVVPADLAERIANAASRAELANAVASLQAELGAVSSRLGDVVTESRGVAAALDARLPEMIARPELIAFAGDLRGQLAEVEARVASLPDPAFVGDLERRLGDLQGALAGAVDARVAALEARAEELATWQGLDELRQSLQGVAEERVASLEARAEELATWQGLDELRQSLQGVAEERVAALESRLGDAATWHALDEVKGSLAGLAPIEALEELRRSITEIADERVAGLEGRLQSVATEHALEEVRERLTAIADQRAALRREAEDRLAAVEARIEGTPSSADVAALGARLDHLSAADAAADHGAAIEQLRADLASERDELRRVAEALAGLDERDARLRSEIESFRDAPGIGSELQDRLDRIDHTVRSAGTRIDEQVATAVARLTAELDAGRDESASVRAALTDLETSLVSRIDDVAVRLTGELTDETGTVRSELAKADERARAAGKDVEQLGRALRDEIEKAAAATGKRLARLEDASASANDRAELEARLARLERTVAEQQEVVEAQGATVEKAVRKGLDRLGRQIADAEVTYLGATESFRQTLSALGQAIAEPDPTFTGERAPVEVTKRKKGGKDKKAAAPGDPTAHGETYVAFVPSPDGYQLVEMSGLAPEQGDRVETEAGVLTVRRVSRSPLPFDERACAYLERGP